jgi:hypothetical protein
MRSGAVLLAAGAAAFVLCGAAGRDESINSSFNAWAIEGLRAARAEWSPEACLGAAEIRSIPGKNEPVMGRTAGGEVYTYFFHSPSIRTASYIFTSPRQPYEAGDVPRVEREVVKGPGEITSPPRCLDSMPVTAGAALAAARKAGILGSGAEGFLAARNLYPADWFDGRCAAHGRLDLSLASELTSIIPHDREIWLVGTGLGMMNSELTFAVIDARTGRILKKGRRPRGCLSGVSGR